MKPSAFPPPELCSARLYAQHAVPAGNVVRTRAGVRESARELPDLAGIGERDLRDAATALSDERDDFERVRIDNEKSCLRRWKGKRARWITAGP